ncbi:MAG: phage replisome organizer N-terminal domain-containing protein [Liquorilactobacillus nagelii]|uniref:phage replisome organizer N-terminal domain-containing protein n=1 Tax=Lactobacillaceae TaxID=33958 RepID=UPI0039EB78BB
MADISWIKLKTSMFDDEKIRLIESMPEADSILIIWIRLLVLAGKTNDSGLIYIQRNMPYTIEMLATLFNKKPNVVRLAIDTLSKFDMINTSKDGLINIVNWEKHQNIEGMERVRKLTAERVKKYREREKAKKIDSNVTATLHNATDSELDSDIDKEKDIEAAAKEPPLPPLSEYSDYFAKIDKYCQTNIGFVAPVWQEALQYDFKDWLKLNSDPKQVTNIICLAIKEACGNTNVSNKVKYAESVLNRWEENNLTTVDEIKADQHNFQQKKEQRQSAYSQRKVVQKEQVPDWDKQAKQQKQYSDEERAQLKAKIAALAGKKED